MTRSVSAENVKGLWLAPGTFGVHNSLSFVGSEEEDSGNALDLAQLVNGGWKTKKVEINAGAYGSVSALKVPTTTAVWLATIAAVNMGLAVRIPGGSYVQISVFMLKAK
jgi:hypothetical protein